MIQTPHDTNSIEPSPEKEMLFELEGNVYIVQKENGIVVGKEVLDGKIVLECVLLCLKRGMDQLEEGEKK